MGSKAAFAIIDRSFCGYSRTPSFADRVAAAPRFDFVAWRLRRELKIANAVSESINNFNCHLEHNIQIFRKEE